MEFGKVIKIKWLRRTIGFVVMLVLFWLIQGCFKEHLNVLCYEDKDEDGFGASSVLPIECLLNCKKGYVENNKDIDDANENCCQEGDRGCDRYDLEITKFMITKHDCLDSIYVVVELKNTGNVELDNVKWEWNPILSSKTVKRYERETTKLHPNALFKRTIQLKNTNQFIARTYLSKLSVNAKQIDTIDSLKKFKIIACQKVCLLPPYLSKNDTIKVEYVVNNTEKENPFMVIPKDTEYISLPENYTSFELYKKIDGDWGKIFPVDTNTIANGSIELGSTITAPSDTLEKIDSLSLNQQEKKAKPNLNKIKNKTDDGAKENPKVLLPKKKFPKKPELPPISEPFKKEKSIDEKEGITIIKEPKERVLPKSPIKPKPVCFSEVGAIMAWDKFVASSKSIVEIESQINAVNQKFYKAIERKEAKQIQKHKKKLDQLCRMLHHKKIKEVKRDKQNK